MTHPENTEKKITQSKLTQSAKHHEEKKSLAERMVGKKPFDWLKVDRTASAAK